MLDVIATRTVKLIDTGRRSKTTKYVKLVKNINKNP